MWYESNIIKVRLGRHSQTFFRMWYIVRTTLSTTGNSLAMALSLDECVVIKCKR